MPDGAKSMRELLVKEMLRYFGETSPALFARWDAALAHLAPLDLRQMAESLKSLEAAINETKRELRAAPSTEH